MQSESTDVSEELTRELARHVNGIIRALLVAGRRGPPAEGRIPFNPLYFNILRTLDADGPCRPSHVAERLMVPRTTVSTAMKALARRGLINAGPDAADGRALSLALTQEGRAVLAAILRQDRRNAAAMLEALDPGERAAFVAALGKVTRGVAGE